MNYKALLFIATTAFFSTPIFAGKVKNTNILHLNEGRLINLYHDIMQELTRDSRTLPSKMYAAKIELYKEKLNRGSTDKLPGTNKWITPGGERNHPVLKHFASILSGNLEHSFTDILLNELQERYPGFYYDKTSLQAPQSTSPFSRELETIANLYHIIRNQLPYLYRCATPLDGVNLIMTNLEKTRVIRPPYEKTYTLTEEEIKLFPVIQDLFMGTCDPAVTNGVFTILQYIAPNKYTEVSSLQIQR